MNIKQTIKEQKTYTINDKMKRVRVARTWSVRFNKLAPRMSRTAFCKKHNLNIFTITRYINQNIDAVRELAKKKDGDDYAYQQIHIPSWDMIEQVNHALEKEGV